jgi:hypothetical protein
MADSIDTTNNGSFLSTLSITTLLPFVLRIGSILTVLIAIAGGILYVKQDNLLVRKNEMSCTHIRKKLTGGKCRVDPF